MTKNLKIRNFPLIIICMLMISAILYSATTVHPALAQGTPNGMFVVPQETILTNAEVGTLFNLNVSIANVTGFVGLEWHLSWNSSLMNCTSMAENLYATVTPPAGQDNIWKIKQTRDNALGIATYAVAYQDTEVALAGGYAPINITSSAYPEGLTTAILTFNVTQAPPVNSFYDCNFTFEVVKVGDINALPIPVANQTGYYRIYGPPETTDTVITFENKNYTVTTVTNASLVPGSMQFANISGGQYKLNFSLTGADGTTAYVNVTVPKALVDITPGDEWTVLVNNTQVTPIITPVGNNTYFYVTATLNTKVDILGTIPEYTMLFIPLLMATTLVAFGLRRRRKL